MKKIKYLLILLLLVATPVFAASDNLFISGETVNEVEAKEGSTFIAGETVTSKNEVDGISFIAGYEVNVNSTSDYLFAAGYNVTIEDATFNDGFISGYEVKIANSNIKRDVYVAADTIRLSSVFNRDVRAAGNNVIINGTIEGDITVYAANLTVKKDAVIKGTLKYDNDTAVTIEEGATIGEKVVEELIESNTSKTFVSVIFGALFGFGNALVVGIILLLLFPKLFKNISEIGKDKIPSTIGFGLITLIFVPLLSIILLITVVGMSLSALVFGFYIASVFLSTVIGSYYIGEKLLSKKVKNKYFIMAIALFAYYLLKAIPFVGTLVMLLVLVLGLGIIVRLLFKRK